MSKTKLDSLINYLSFGVIIFVSYENSVDNIAVLIYFMKPSFDVCKAFTTCDIVHHYDSMSTPFREIKNRILIEANNERKTFMS